MNRALPFISCLPILLCVSAEPAKPTQPASRPVPPALDFTLRSLDGKEVHLSRYQRQVVLMVNVASKCGFTRQYAGLQELHRLYAERGLAILAFPCNDFGGQEPGTPEQIQSFCRSNYAVSFPLFEKVSIKGESKCALYKHLTENAPEPGEVKWNFEKFLLGRDGRILARFRSKVTPADIAKAIEAEIARPE